jgi:hypothetical protein
VSNIKGKLHWALAMEVDGAQPARTTQFPQHPCARLGGVRAAAPGEDAQSHLAGALSLAKGGKGAVR